MERGHCGISQSGENKFNMSWYQKNKLSPEDIAEIIKLSETKGLSELAEKFKANRGTIRYHLKKNNKVWIKKTAIQRRKLSPEQEEEIINLCQQKTAIELAEMYEVSNTSIYNFFKRKEITNWKKRMWHNKNILPKKSVNNYKELLEIENEKRAKQGFYQLKAMPKMIFYEKK